MAKQDIKALVLGDNFYGALELRVLDILTPLVGVTAPAENAEFVGQKFIDTVAGKQYFSIATDSVAPADDWVLVTSA